MWMAHLSFAVMNSCDSTHPVDGQACAKPAQPSGSSLLQQSYVASVSKEQPVRLIQGSKEWMTEKLRHELAQSKSLSSMFDRLSKSTDIPDKTKQLFSLFRICANCEHFERLGETYDGGYLTCVDHNSSNPSIGAFSLGVEHHDQWSEDVVKILGAKKVFQYDCTVQAPPAACPRCQFHKKCIRGASQIGANDDSSWTLQEAIDNAGFKDAPDNSLIMKMDIEGSEWDALKEFGQTDLQKFKQIAIEYHWIDSEHYHEKYVMALMNLQNAGFAPVHIHGNNWAGMYSVGEFTIPNVLEVTYVRPHHSGPHLCVADQLFKSLDAPNNPNADELPTAHLASPSDNRLISQTLSGKKTPGIKGI